jgi:hypothetical protein
MDTQLGYWRWKLFRWNEHPNPYRNRPDLALTWLTQFQNNTAVMAELQQLLVNSTTGPYTPYDPRIILQQLADKMSTGEIQVCVEVCGPVALKTISIVVAEEAEPDLSQLKRAPAPATAPPATAPPDEPTLGPNNDPDCQSKSLKDAAEEGAPFCEECEKSENSDLAAVSSSQLAVVSVPKQSEPQSSSSTSDTLGPNNDAIAQVKALKEASEKGAFFCEECEKTRKAYEARHPGSAPPQTPTDQNPPVES